MNEDIKDLGRDDTYKAILLITEFYDLNNITPFVAMAANMNIMESILTINHANPKLVMKFTKAWKNVLEDLVIKKRKNNSLR